MQDYLFTFPVIKSVYIRIRFAKIAAIIYLLEKNVSMEKNIYCIYIYIVYIESL